MGCASYIYYKNIAYYVAGGYQHEGNAKNTGQYREY
ncbi:MAG: hypothetical protein ACFWUE_01965 [Xylanivirga thermophila]|jgi:hypothetical protein